MDIVKIIASICVCFAFASCTNTKGPKAYSDIHPIPKVKTNLTEQSEAIGKVREEITEQANTIKSEGSSISTDVDQGEKVAPAPQWEQIKEKITRIQESNDKIIDKANELSGIQVKVATAQTEVEALTTYTKETVNDVEDLRKTIDDQKEKIEDFESGARKQQKIIWMGVVALSAIGLVLGVFLAIYVSPKAGGGLVIGSLLLSPIAYFMAAYASIVAITGGVIFLLVIGYLIFYAAKHRKALIESMTSFELTKHKNWSDPNTKKEVSDVQSNSTKKIIRDLKHKEQIG
jgi:hypothetical protein